MRNVENAECKKKFNFPFQFPTPHYSLNVHGECGKRGVCNMEINE